MLVSNVDQLPVQIVSRVVEVELTSYYQSRKGHLCNLTKYISRLSVMTDRTTLLTNRMSTPKTNYKNCIIHTKDLI